MGKLSRTKGASLEREFVRLMRSIWPDATRNYEQAAKSDGRDVLHTPGFCVQLKGGKAPPWKAGLREAEGSADTNEVAFCATRKDHEGWVVHIPLAGFKLVLKGEMR